MIEHYWIIIVFTGVFFSILFIQSSLDKIFNWKSELEFNKQHFEKTFLKPTVPMMLVVLTIMELSSGLLSASGVVMLFINRHTMIPFCASCLCSLTFIMLFFGQRIAKDYGGAQSLVSYFILSILTVLYTSILSLPLPHL
jgi:putative oxidoreductase